MAWIPFAIMAAQAAASALSNRGSTGEQTGSATTTQGTDTNANFSSMPQYDPTTLAMRNALIQQYMQRLGSDPNKLAQSITYGGLQQNNRGAEIAQRTASGILASRGLASSPISGVIGSNINTQRIMKGADILNQNQVTLDQIIQQRLNDTAKFMTSLPYGQSGTSYQQQLGTQHTDQSGTVTNPGNILGGAATGLAQSLAALYGAGAFSNKPNSFQFYSPSEINQMWNSYGIGNEPGGPG